MSDVIQFEDKIRVEIAANPTAGRPVADGQTNKIGIKFADAIAGLQGVIEPTARMLQSSIANLAVEDVKLEFGLAFSSQGNLVIVSGKAEGTLKVTMVVKRSEAQQ